VLESEALPLLRGIADGRLDPSVAAVRDQCERGAAKLRRALVDRVGARSELLAELEPVLAEAGERGLPVEIRTVGDPGYVSPQVIHWAVGAVDRLLRALEPQQVVLTMLAAGDEVELYLVFRGPLAGSASAGSVLAQTPQAHGGRAALDVDDSGTGCLEVRWPKEVM
jgi:hypothetical protein